jgi:hypothetical protein
LPGKAQVKRKRFLDLGPPKSLPIDAAASPKRSILLSITVPALGNSGG